MSLADPISEFLAAAERARTHSIDIAPAALATSSPDGRPSIRIVLVRHIDDRGFVFYTNYTSRKARELADNPFASLCFFWPALEEQIRVEGPVTKVSEAESDRYFATRPRGGQLGAWASEQSALLPSREALEARFQDMDKRFTGRVVPRPPFWGGYRLAPARVEFWHGRADRLHDRIVYVKDGPGWRIERLYP
ncbi:MAG: pyridoxamine 5'-phosphate oxidase [Acidobacteria bacterium]|nr:pyridoxamine 5'-phosphate oxidase [Acidobacteriota bacterium]